MQSLQLEIAPRFEGQAHEAQGPDHHAPDYNLPGVSMKTSRARSGHASAGLSAETCWRAVLDRDALADGTFVFGVLTTGVYCRPSCPARRPLRRNVRFYETPGAAEREGLRACLRCKPLDPSAGKAKLAERLCRYMEANSGQKITLTTLSKVAGISRFYLQRLFTAEVGVSPAEYLQACRFAQFKQGLRGRSVTDAWAEAGYGSSSRVYETARSRLGSSEQASAESASGSIGSTAPGR